GRGRRPKFSACRDRKQRSSYRCALCSIAISAAGRFWFFPPRQPPILPAMKQPRGTWRGLIAVALSLSMGLGVGACKSGNAAQKLATSTAPTLEGSTGKCKPGNEGSKSLVVEWPMGERAALEGRVQRGLVAVRYRNCEMELIT